MESEKEGFKLWDFQGATVEQIIWLIEEKKRPRILCVAPTGSGKTIMAVEIMKWEVARMGSVLFFAHRRELIKQCSSKLESYGLEHGIIMGREEKSILPDIQVASVQTLARRLNKNGQILPRATMIIIDEAHHANAKSYREIITFYPDAVVVGFTATPIRGDGTGLGIPELEAVA